MGGCVCALKFRTSKQTSLKHWVMWLLQLGHMTLTTGSYDSYNWLMWLTTGSCDSQLGHMTLTTGSCDLQRGHVTHNWIMWLTTGSCDLQLGHVTHNWIINWVMWLFTTAPFLGIPHPWGFHVILKAKECCKCTAKKFIAMFNPRSPWSNQIPSHELPSYEQRQKAGWGLLTRLDLQSGTLRKGCVI